jgi:hypothetical protein
LGEFDPTKIGTGEGAQAYGVGAGYLADAEPVAKGYRDVLAREHGVSNVWRDRNGNIVDMHDLANGPSTDPNAAAANWMKQRGGPEAGITPALDEARATKPEDFVGGVAERQATIDGLMSFERRGVGQRPGGHMYEVQVNADPAHFLDWDKPLSEQHPVVKDALSGLGVPDASYMTGQMAHDWLARRAVVEQNASRADAPISAAQRLNDAGIPGIRYLDAGSRNAGGWNITPPNQTVSGKWMVKSNDYNSQGIHFDNEADAQAALADKIAGQTRNSVVFDANTMDIIRRYGLAGLMAGGGAAAGMQTPSGGDQP